MIFEADQILKKQMYNSPWMSSFALFNVILQTSWLSNQFFQRMLQG